ncbi:MAG: YdjY domain-containing protein [Candidatus Poribacteria bacterium]|nr:YdjY domain-containing protein [Candidatus Poribacteria bacterium]
MLIKRRSKIRLVLLIVLIAFASACNRELPNRLAASVGELSVEQPIYIDRATKAVWLAGEVRANAFNTSTQEDAQYHAIVWKEGRAKRNSLFLTHAADVDVHGALVEVGAQPGDNLTLDSWDERFAPEHPHPALRVEGSPVEISVRWEGSPRTYRLSEILDDSERQGFDFRFGGNLAYVKKWRSGCVACLYSCPGGKVSNASYTIRDFVDEATSFRAREDLLPPDGTAVILILKIKDSKGQ